MPAKVTGHRSLDALTASFNAATPGSEQCSDDKEKSISVGAHGSNTCTTGIFGGLNNCPIGCITININTPASKPSAEEEFDSLFSLYGHCYL